jgi:hypothetical protein
MLRIAEAVPDAMAVGVDIFGPDIERGRANAAERELAHRVTFVEGSATDHAAPADVVLSTGAYQAFGTFEEALKALRALVARAAASSSRGTPPAPRSGCSPTATIRMRRPFARSWTPRGTSGCAATATASDSRC